jgi:hypothetical protein
MLYTNSHFVSLQGTKLRKHSFVKNVSKITKTHKNPPNVVTVHVVSTDRNARQRKKRQHPHSHSKRKFQSYIAEDKTSNEECIKYISESETTSEESNSDNDSTSESSEKRPSPFLTSPQERNKTSRSRILKTGPAGSKTSDHSTA